MRNVLRLLQSVDKFSWDRSNNRLTCFWIFFSFVKLFHKTRDFWENNCPEPPQILVYTGHHIFLNDSNFLVAQHSIVVVKFHHRSMVINANMTTGSHFHCLTTKICFESIQDYWQLLELIFLAKLSMSSFPFNSLKNWCRILFPFHGYSQGSYLTLNHFDTVNFSNPHKILIP